MKINEYGGGNPECILLIHPSLVTWDYFENVIMTIGWRNQSNPRLISPSDGHYGAEGTYRMRGTHCYEYRDGAWVAVNR